MQADTRIGAAIGALTAMVALGTAVTAPAYAAPPPAPRVDWKPCPDVPNVDCGSVRVPVDWSRPDGPTIDLALARQKATDPAARVGSVLVDPGGPGGSGVDWVKGGLVLSAEIHRRFDVVGFDPRGVGGSHPVRCDPELEAQPVPAVPADAAEFARVVAHNRALGESCRKLTGPLFDFVDTASVARDMDAIRAALGEPKLNYYGISYGTLMGQQYAELFPRQIRTMVLDSDMDHSLPTTWQFLRTEATAAQDSFDQFVAWCDRAAGCAMHGRDVHAAFADLYARAVRGTLTFPGSDLKVEPFELLSMVNQHFYQPGWQYLAEFLLELTTGQRPPALARSAGAPPATVPPAGRAGHGAPVPDPFAAVFCQDWRVPVHSFAELEVYRSALDIFAPDMKLSPLGWHATLSCAGWPAHARNPQHRLTVRGAPPILMLNSRYDPATPYEWAVAAAHQTGAVLLTYDGWGHGAYFKNSACVTDATDAYLITGRPPRGGSHCPAVEPPVAPSVEPPVAPSVEPPAAPSVASQPTPRAPAQPRRPLPDVPAWAAPRTS